MHEVYVNNKLHQGEVGSKHEWATAWRMVYPGNDTNITETTYLH